MEQVKRYSATIDRENYPEVIPEALPEVYYEAPQVYQDAPEVFRNTTQLPPTGTGRKLQWWKRHRKRALVCILVIIIAIVGGAAGGSIAATSHKSTTTANPKPTSTATTAAIQTAYSFPTAISPLPGRTAILGTTQGLSNTMWYKSFQNTTWDTNFTTIGGAINPSSWANIGVTSRFKGILDVFAVGTDRSCVQKHWSGNLTGGVWTLPATNYIVLAGDLSSSVETMSSFPSRVDVFGLTEAQRLTQLTWINGQTTPWTEVVGQNTSMSWLFAPSVVIPTPNRGDVFVVDAKTLHISQLAWIGSGVNPTIVQNIGGSCTSRPSATSSLDGRIDIFCRDANALLSWSSLPSLSSSWTAWKPVTGSPAISNEPHAISRLNGTLQIFVQTVNDTVALADFDGRAWQWTDLGGTVMGPPKALSNNALSMEVYVYDKSGALKHKSWNNGSWTTDISLSPSNGWADLGTP